MARFESLQDWLDWQEQYHPRLIDLGLERAAEVFKKLHPAYEKPLTITVGGTNGKGSCIAFLEAIYKAQGYRVGSYTSPHLLNYNERIRIDGQAVCDKLICEAFARIDSVRDDVSLSYFEFGTLAAVDIFSHSGLDVQLLEVGMGGRLDAVNIIDPDLAVITSVCIDHIDWLGGTREAIGLEKAGIFRPGIPVVIGDVNPPDSLVKAAKEKKGLLSCINADFDYRQNAPGWNFNSKTRDYRDLPPPALKGQHQFNNASTAIMATANMQAHLPVSNKAIAYGLQNASLTGRFQLIDDDIPVLLDVAHNPQAVKMLSDYLQTHFADKKIHAVFAIMKDKDIGSIIDIMKTVVSDWFISPLNTMPRAATESMLHTLFEQKNLGNHASFGFQDLAAAMAAAKKNAKKDELILIFGSFFLVSEYLTEFEND